LGLTAWKTNSSITRHRQFFKKYSNGKTILDADEKRILKEVKDWKHTSAALSPIGRQGILLGRGNQQLVPRFSNGSKKITSSLLQQKRNYKVSMGTS
jgi:predicted polyphosphate/ATP-dependent NAD kinase